jgi:hypothetical protein
MKNQAMRCIDEDLRLKKEEKEGLVGGLELLSSSRLIFGALDPVTKVN